MSSRSSQAGVGCAASALPAAGQFGRRYELGDRDFVRLSEFIQTSVGIKMPPAKKSMLELRLARRLRALGMDSFDEYCAHVFDSGAGQGEIVSLVDHVTTNKTEFFRESEHFDYLTRESIPRLAAGCPEMGRTRPLRIWSAGCSSGEEPYSIAMTLSGSSGLEEELDFLVLATDLSTAMLSKAVQAIYSDDRVADLPEGLKRRCFLRGKNEHLQSVRVAPHIRRRVRFEWLNLLAPYEFGEQFDVVFCRNTLIYFERDVQIDVLSRIAECMVPGGYLFVGHSETLHGMGLPLVHVAPTIYRRMA